MYDLVSKINNNCSTLFNFFYLSHPLRKRYIFLFFYLFLYRYIHTEKYVISFKILSISFLNHSFHIVLIVTKKNIHYYGNILLERGLIQILSPFKYFLSVETEMFYHEKLRNIKKIFRDAL